MRLNLLWTHWSLLFITLISSCFLFYVVATEENAKYATTTEYTASDASMASNAAEVSPSPLSMGSDTDTDTIETAAADEQKIVKPKENRKDKTVNILPNYKKVKKLPTPQHHPPSPASSHTHNTNHNSPTGDGHDGKLLNSPSAAHIAADSAVDLGNSDTVVVNEIDSVDKNNLVLNKNDDIVNLDGSSGGGGGDNRNNNNENIHSSLEEESNSGEPRDGGEGGNAINEQPQQMPDVVDTEITNDDNVVGIDDNADKEKSLPDITDIPTVTITELPLEILQPPQNSMDSVIIGGDVGESRTADEYGVVNRTVDIVVDDNEGDIQKDGQIVKINDSGGGSGDGAATITLTTNFENPEIATTPPSPTTTTTTNIPNDTSTNATQDSSSAHNDSGVEQHNTSTSSSSSTANTASQANLTAEEVPMPVFSEWAQKQMEEAEKQALEQEQTFNNSAQRKNSTNGNGKPPAMKIRAKNYASPDCGAKIIASSAYTSNAGAVLSASKDEYMLSLCGNRIWFVVELCEAIQAQKIDFANFELYSSSPQNFTVAVSKRFPTREWSNVGRFVAEDKRAVQGFDLHPHLFGKFVRVEINSHYSKEHFCTLSLFRVFGTSEFEAFETENHPNDDMDDFDDEDMQEQSKNSEPNLFKSASDAVLSIVKKATELVGKPSHNQNQTFKTPQHAVVCRTPMYGLFSCADCSSSLVERVNNALSCEFSQLNSLLSVADIRNDLLNTRVCAKLYGIETKQHLTPQKDIKQSFYVNILPNDYVGALCQLLAMPKIQQKLTDRLVINDTDNKEQEETSTNQTLDKKFGKEDLELLDKPETKLIKPEMPVVSEKPEGIITTESVQTSTEIPLDDNQQQLPRPLETAEDVEVTTATPNIVEQPSIPDKNIFNVPAEELPPSETELPEQQSVETPTTSTENLEQSLPPLTTHTATTPPPKIDTLPTTTPHSPPAAQVTPRSEEDSNSWDNIDILLTSTPPSVAPVGLPQHNGAGGNLNQKLSNGPQSESVFIRLSNRIKALERNMSLSGQYLEELSRRYKKQVEELQQTLTQQIQTVRTLEEQNNRHHELEQLYAQRNTQLKHELDDLTLQVHACIVVIIFVGAFVFLVLMVGILFYRSLRRDTKEVLALYGKGGRRKTEVSNTSSMQKKLNRRKSFEDFDHQQLRQRRREEDAKSASSCEKLRRPSEEAMLILKDCRGDTKMVVGQVNPVAEPETDAASNNGAGAGRQRKVSVCYGSNNNINATTGLPPPLQTQKSIGGGRRKGEKHSWPNTAHAQLQALQHLEQLNSEDLIGDSPEITSMKSKKPNFFNGPPPLNVKSKKKKDYLRRQESSPAENTNLLNNTSPADLNSAADFDEKLMLDEDDLDNFIPNADLAYNEFMPDGPRGYQCLASQANANNPASKKTQSSKSDGNSKKSRRLSSPVFFKSPFTKSLKVDDLRKT